MSAFGQKQSFTVGSYQPEADVHVDLESLNILACISDHVGDRLRKPFGLPRNWWTGS